MAVTDPPSMKTGYIRSLHRLPHLKWRAFDDSENDRRPAIVWSGLAHNFSNGRLVVILNARPNAYVSSFSVTVVTNCSGGLPKSFEAPRRPETSSRRAALRKSRWTICLYAPPPADSVKVVERESQWVHAGVATRANGVLAVLLHALAHCSCAAYLCYRSEEHLVAGAEAECP